MNIPVCSGSPKMVKQSNGKSEELGEKSNG